MAQNPFVRPTLGISFCTSMSRPDAALALAAIYGLESRRVSRAGAICVAGAGLAAATFCDIVWRFYTVGATPNANDVLPVGLAVVDPMPPDPPMVLAANGRRNPEGELQYARMVRRIADTSQAEAMLRNGVTFTEETAFVLSAPATALARCLDLLGVKALFAARVKRLVIVDAGEPVRDVPALRKVLAEWPAPIVLVGKDVGDALPFPGSSLATSFAWAEAHPVVDAYRAFRPMPYDTPTCDLVAVYHASQPDSDLFQLSEPGTVTVSDAGRVTFAPGGTGTVRALAVVPATREQALQALVEVATADPVAPRRRGRGPA
jgi:hypothetical protein